MFNQGPTKKESVPRGESQELDLMGKSKFGKLGFDPRGVGGFDPRGCGGGGGGFDPRGGGGGFDPRDGGGESLFRRENFAERSMEERPKMAAGEGAVEDELVELLLKLSIYFVEELVH